MRRLAPLALALGLLGCPGPKSAPPPTPAPPPKPTGNGKSVLLITVDTLRADHLSAYGYPRPTSPRIDAFAREATLFEQAYTYWPKTRGSFVAMLTGRRASRSGYGKSHPLLLEMNPTLASVLAEAGYATAAVVDNPNVAGSLGYAKGFASYRETWTEAGLKSEMEKTEAITQAGVKFLGEASPERPFFLWLHYVNPHAPYTPPPPYDTAFLGSRTYEGPALPVVSSFRGGIPRQWAVPGHNRLGFYVAQYDGEIATADEHVGKVLDALDQSRVKEATVVLLTSDHGESLGEHDYFFDHGEDVFDPSLRIPLVVRVPGVRGGQRLTTLASTLDVVPTLLDAVKVSYPPELNGRSLLPAVRGQDRGAPERLYAQNDRTASATFDARWKIVATPKGQGRSLALYDRARDPGESQDAARMRPDEFRTFRRELELFQDRVDQEWARLRRELAGVPAGRKLDPEACARLKAMGYVVAECE